MAEEHTRQRRRRIGIVAASGFVTTAVLSFPFVLMVALISDGSGSRVLGVTLWVAVAGFIGLCAGLACGVSMGDYPRLVRAGVFSGLAALALTWVSLSALGGAGVGPLVAVLPVVASCVGGAALGRLFRFLRGRG